MKIIVGFSSSKPWYNIGSKIIELAQKRPYSHCYVRYIDPWTGVDLVAQAAHGFVNEFNYEIFCQKNQMIEEYSFDIAESELKEFFQFIKSNLGKPYGYLELVLIGIKMVFHYEIKIDDKDNSFICSEFAGRVLDVLKIIPTQDQDYLTPSDLNTLIKQVKGL